MLYHIFSGLVCLFGTAYNLRGISPSCLNLNETKLYNKIEMSDISYCWFQHFWLRDGWMVGWSKEAQSEPGLPIRQTREK